MKGIILAGGFGTRLMPITRGVSKHLIPIYDKPMIFYPLSTLMLAGIKEIAVITKIEDQASYKNLLGNGSKIGISIQYFVQNKPNGIGEAFLICEEFIGKDSVALILGDNIFYGSGFGATLKSFQPTIGAQIFAYKVKNPSDFGVINFSSTGEILEILEKPKLPKSNLAIPGIYFFDNSVVSITKGISPSQRNEIEIISILNIYRENRNLSCTILPRGTVWLDGGTLSSLQEATNFIAAVQERSGMKIGCIEEIAWRNNWISNAALVELSKDLRNTTYGDYLQNLIGEK